MYSYNYLFEVVRIFTFRHLLHKLRENGLPKDSVIGNFFRTESDKILDFSGFETFLATGCLSFVVFTVSVLSFKNKLSKLDLFIISWCTFLVCDEDSLRQSYYLGDTYNALQFPVFFFSFFSFLWLCQRFPEYQEIPSKKLF